MPFRAKKNFPEKIIFDDLHPPPPSPKKFRSVYHFSTQIFRDIIQIFQISQNNTISHKIDRISDFTSRRTGFSAYFAAHFLGNCRILRTFRNKARICEFPSNFLRTSKISSKFPPNPNFLIISSNYFQLVKISSKEEISSKMEALLIIVN